MPTYLIIGSFGQDGVLLRSMLEKSKNKVFGVAKPNTNVGNYFDGTSNTFYSNFWEIDTALSILRAVKPDVIFHLAAVNGPSGSNALYSSPDLKFMAHCVQVEITKNIICYLEDQRKESQLILAGSSKMYSGYSSPLVVDEETKTCPTDYYGELKEKSFHLIQDARRNGLRASTAIMFNHESVHRKPGFLFRDMAREIALVLSKKKTQIELRNANIVGDWHSANDTVRGLYLMSVQEHARDYVFAKGERQSIDEIICDYFSKFQSRSSPNVLSKNPKKQDVCLIGNYQLAQKHLSWVPSTPVTNDLHDLVLQELASFK